MKKIIMVDGGPRRNMNTAAMLIIIFVGLLLADLIGQVVNFFRSLYIEIIFRT